MISPDAGDDELRQLFGVIAARDVPKALQVLANSPALARRVATVGATRQHPNTYFFAEIGHYAVAWAALCLGLRFQPLLEEAVYRVILSASLVTLIGQVPTILVSGFVFAALHFVYGNPAPDNALAGFVFAWAYLKSESVTLPIIMHGCGNLVVIGAQLAAAALVS